MARLVILVVALLLVPFNHAQWIRHVAYDVNNCSARLWIVTGVSETIGFNYALSSRHACQVPLQPRVTQLVVYKGEVDVLAIHLSGMSVVGVNRKFVVTLDDGPAMPDDTTRIAVRRFTAGTLDLGPQFWSFRHPVLGTECHVLMNWIALTSRQWCTGALFAFKFEVHGLLSD